MAPVAMEARRRHGRKLAEGRRHGGSTTSWRGSCSGGRGEAGSAALDGGGRRSSSGSGEGRLGAPAVELDGRRRHGSEEEVGAMRARGGRSAREERGSGKRRRQRERWGIDRLGFGLGGPRGWAFGRRLQDGPAWEAGWALSLLSPLFLWQKTNREK